MKCLVCSENVEEFVHNSIGFAYCGACNFYFKDPKNFQDFTKQKERYDLHTNNASDEGYRAYYNRFLEFIMPHMSGVNHALDFGCGKSTLLASMLEEKGIQCDYYDPIYHPDTLERTKLYDLIVSTEVFEHLHNPSVVFKELIGLLKEGGMLAIQTEFHLINQEAFKQWYYHKDPTHVCFFTPKSFEYLIKKNGGKYIKDNAKNMVLVQI